jgi:hypothetical protein
MTEFSPYHQALRQDLIDYEALRAGLDAYERISGVPAEDALVHLATATTPEQRDRVLKRCERGEEFYRLPEELQARLREVI